MESKIRKKLATIVILFLQSGKEREHFVFTAEGFGKTVEVNIRVVKEPHVICDTGE